MLLDIYCFIFISRNSFLSVGQLIALSRCVALRAEPAPCPAGEKSMPCHPSWSEGSTRWASIKPQGPMIHRVARSCAVPTCFIHSERWPITLIEQQDPGLLQGQTWLGKKASPNQSCREPRRSKMPAKLSCSNLSLSSSALTSKRLINPQRGMLRAAAATNRTRGKKTSQNKRKDGRLVLFLPILGAVCICPCTAQQLVGARGVFQSVGEMSAY